MVPELDQKPLIDRKVRDLTKSLPDVVPEVDQEPLIDRKVRDLTGS